jgi:micrococcal nuclease
MPFPVLLCFVVAISDGDTLTARCDHQTVKVRLAQIDAPEKNQAYGQRSKQSLSNICFNKQAVIKPETIDKYGRTVAHVECDGIEANREQVKQGMAWVYDKYAKDQTLYLEQDSAKGNKRGLWADEAVPPWVFRSAK